MSGLKSKADRLKETITLLKKLPEIGVPRESSAYSEVQDLMTEWVNGGPAKKEQVDFSSHWGYLRLPITSDAVSSLDLKLKKKGE
jgi:hypothetical protein